MTSSAEILLDTSQTSWYDWDSQDGCDNLYVGSTAVLLPASITETLGMLMLDRQFVPGHAQDVSKESACSHRFAL